MCSFDLVVLFVQSDESDSLPSLFSKNDLSKVIHSFHFIEHKSDSLFLRVGFAPFWRENWKLDLKFFFTLFGFAFIKKESNLLFIALQRSSHSFKRERFTLHRSSCSVKKSDESDLLFFVKKRAIRTMYVWRMHCVLCFALRSKLYKPNLVFLHVSQWNFGSNVAV